MCVFIYAKSCSHAHVYPNSAKQGPSALSRVSPVTVSAVTVSPLTVSAVTVSPVIVSPTTAADATSPEFVSHITFVSPSLKNATLNLTSQADKLSSKAEKEAASEERQASKAAARTKLATAAKELLVDPALHPSSSIDK
eukprot:g1298.t1